MVGTVWQGVNDGHDRWRVRVLKAGVRTVEFECVGGAGSNVKARKRMTKERFVHVFVPTKGNR